MIKIRLPQDDKGPVSVRAEGVRLQTSTKRGRFASAKATVMKPPLDGCSIPNTRAL